MPGPAGRRQGGGGPIFADIAPERSRIVLREQHLHRDLGIRRVGDEGVAVSVCKPRRLDEPVHAVRRKRVLRRLEPLEHVEDEQGDDADAVGRAFEHGVAAIVAGDRLDILRLAGREVLFRVQAAERAQLAYHVRRNLALVERRPAFAGNPLQRLCKLGLAECAAFPDSLAARQEARRRVGVAGKAPRGIAPVRSRAGMDDEAFLGIADRRLQELVEALAAMVLQKLLPGIDGAGHGHRMRARFVECVDAPLPEPLRRKRSRRVAGPVERNRRRRAGGRVEAEAVPADAGGLRLGHAHHRAGGDRGIDGVAARPQHLHPGQRRGGLARGDHRVGRADGRAARNMKIAHRRGVLAPNRHIFHAL